MSEVELEAIVLSLQVAFISVVICMPPAIAVGFVLARKEFRLKALLEAVVLLPLVLPPVVTGYVLLLLLGPAGPIGGAINELFDIQLAFNWKGAALAASVVSFPLIVRSVRASFEAVPPRMEHAARTLGANSLEVFRRVSLPLSLPGILAGAIVGFGRSLGEFGATITFAGNIPGETRTLPLAIYSAAYQVDGEHRALRLVLIGGAIAIVAVVVSEWLLRSGWYTKPPKSKRGHR